MSFEAFYRDTYRSILGVAIALTGSMAEAEDLTQEAFLAAHRRWDRISEYEKPGAWVRRVLVNRATSLRRRWSAEMRAMARVGPSDTSTEMSPETDEVWSHVRKLPRRQQQAIALHYVAQLSMEETAHVMGCSPGAVKTHLHRGRQTLRSSLQDWRQEWT